MEAQVVFGHMGKGRSTDWNTCPQVLLLIRQMASAANEWSVGHSGKDCNAPAQRAQPQPQVCRLLTMEDTFALQIPRPCPLTKSVVPVYMYSSTHWEQMSQPVCVSVCRNHVRMDSQSYITVTPCGEQLVQATGQWSHR